MAFSGHSMKFNFSLGVALTLFIAIVAFRGFAGDFVAPASPCQTISFDGGWRFFQGDVSDGEQVLYLFRTISGQSFEVQRNGRIANVASPAREPS